MKTFVLSHKTAGAALGLLFSFLLPASLVAGPGAQAWTVGKPLTTTSEAARITPGSTIIMVCGACKTVVLSEYKSPLPNGRATPQWLEIGAKHTCEHCGGEISVVRGKTADSMQHNCSKCGEGAAFCCVTAAHQAAPTN